MKTSEVLAKQIENPGTRELKKITDSDTTGPRNLLRGLGVVLGAPYFAAKDAMGTKLSDEDKAQLKREVTRSNKGADPEYKKGGAVRSASKRADGIAQRGKTRA
tara:strand:+ start:1103 stop:1414 length:312 start_codon:yes stop_codon:yes gene_type:complete